MEIQDIQDNFVFFSERDLFEKYKNHSFIKLFTFHRVALLESLLTKIDEKYIFFDCLDEYEPPLFITNIFWKKLNFKLKAENKYLIFLIGSPKTKQYQNVDWLGTNIKSIHLPLSSIFWSVDEMNTNSFFDTVKTPTKIEYFIRCFNRYPHRHRCILIDKLSQYNLIENNLISWNIINDEYNFEYFEQKKLIVDYDLTQIQQNKVMFNEQIKSSLFDLVTESNTDYLFYSEKTWKSYLQNNSISIFLGSQYQNISLQKYGFELYDEVIDYKFDSYPLYEDRVDSLLEQINYLREKDFQLVYDKVKKKINHNSDNVLEIFNNKKYIDPIISNTFDKIFIEKIKKTIFNDTLGIKTLMNI